MRAFLGLLFFAGLAAAISAPFVATSRALDAYGITIPGSVYHKSEYLKVNYSHWELSREVTIEYTIPETRSASFFPVQPSAEVYDSLHAGQKVELRYLPRDRVPSVPGAQLLWQMHTPQTVRAANISDIPRLHELLTPFFLIGGLFLAAVITLVLLWRSTRWSVFAWGAAFAFLPVLACLLIQDFPLATPAPARDIRIADGHVRRLEQITKLFAGQRSGGIIAGQPVDVVSVEFLPEGRTEPVVAVDLIDHGSLRELKEQSAVRVAYELSTPRTAHLAGATRNFPARNVQGAAAWVAACVALTIAFVALCFLLGRVFRRLP